MEYTSQSYIVVTIYNSRTLDVKNSVNYLSQSSGTTGKPTQLISSLNTGISRGT